MYKVYLLDAAVDELANLDKSVGRRVARRIRWLAENVEAINPIALKGDLAGLYKLRVLVVMCSIPKWAARETSSLAAERWATPGLPLDL